MWKKAMLPLLLLLLLAALLLAQLVATESTQPAVNAKDISTSSSSIERSVETTLDMNDNDDSDANADEATATIETYEDDEERSEVTMKAMPQLTKTATNNENASAEVANDDSDEGNIHVYEDVGVEGVGVGVGVDDVSGEGSADAHDGGGNSDSDSLGDRVAGVGEASEVSPLNIRGRDRLAAIMMREVTLLIDYALEQQRSVVNQFLQDDTIEMVKCATMEVVKKSCTSFIAAVGDALKMDKGNDFLAQYAQFGVKTLMASNFETFVEQHNTTRIKQPTAENVIINKALKKAGVLQIELEMQKRFVEFSKLFNRTVGEYVDTLLPNERKFDAPLLEWYEEFKTAMNISSQVIALTKFLPLYKNIFSIEIESH